MGNERFPRRTDLAIWFATLAFLGLAIQEAAAATPATATPSMNPATPASGAPLAAKAAAPSPRDTYQRECGDCHVAYPPRLLPAADWRRIVGTLDRHFGVDASLDAATSASIAAWLESNAGRARGGGEHEDEEGGHEGGRGSERDHEREATPRLPRSASPTSTAIPTSTPAPALAAAQPRAASPGTTVAAGKSAVPVAAQPQPPLPRISTSPWFRREHDEIAASTWKRPAIGSAARCEACHTDAAQGRFSERAIRIPR